MGKLKINARKVCDIAKFSNEEIFGKDSIRDHAVIDSKNPKAPGYQKYTVTGSQAGIGMGQSKWQSPAELWALKTGKIEPENDEDKEVFKAGHAAEEFVANMFVRKMLEEFDNIADIELIDDTTMYQHKKYRFMLADCDRFAVIKFVSGKETLVGLECKTTYNKPSIDAWKEGLIPPQYEDQCRHYMAVTDINAWYICCCWGFTIKDCAVCLITRDTDKESELIATESTFIECCETDIEPALPEENLETTLSYYNAVYGGLKENTVDLELTPENSALVDKALNLATKEAEIKKLTAEVKAIKEEITAELVKGSDGTATKFNYSEDGINYTTIEISAPTKRDSVNVDKLLSEQPSVKAELEALGLSKITKTDIGKLKVDGKKIDTTPYVIPGGVDISKPLSFDSVSSWIKAI